MRDGRLRAYGPLVVFSLLWAVIDGIWYSGVIWLAGRVRRVLGSPVVRRRMERVSGAVLIGLGVQPSNRRDAGYRPERSRGRTLWRVTEQQGPHGGHFVAAVDQEAPAWAVRIPAVRPWTALGAAGAAVGVWSRTPELRGHWRQWAPHLAPKDRAVVYRQWRKTAARTLGWGEHR